MTTRFPSTVGVGGNGYGCGKSTVARVLVEDYGYREVNFADKLKELALAIDPVIQGYSEWDKEEHRLTDIRLAEEVSLFGWETVKEAYPEARRFLQRLGTEGGRKVLGEDFWVDQWQQTVDSFEPLFQTLVVAGDMRFPNEVAAVAFSVYVYRPNFDAPTDHTSEQLDRDACDIVILNDGTRMDLVRTVHTMMGNLT